MLEKKLYFVILNLLVSFFLNLIPFYLSVNYLGRENLGIIGYALSSVTIFSFLYDLGFDMNFMRFLSEDKKELEGKIGTYFYSKLVLIGITFVISLFFNASWAIIHKWDTFLIATVNIFIIYQVFQGLSSSFVYIFNSQGKIAKSQIPQTIGYLIQAIVTIICIIFDLGIFVIVLGYVIASFSTLIINIILFLGNKIGLFNKKYFNEIRKYILPLMLVAIFYMIAENLDTILIKINYDASETGIYQFVIRLKPLLFVIANAVMFIYIPIFTSVYNELGKDSVKKVIIFFEKFIYLIGIPFLIIVVLLNQPLILTFFNEYEKATVLLSIYAIIATIMTFTRLFSTALLGINNLKGFFFSYGFQYLIIIFLDVVLITKSMGNLGSLGAVISQLIASVIGILISHYYLRKEFQYKQKFSNYLFWLYASISIISTYFILQLDFFNYYNTSNFILQIFTLIVLGLGIYFIISFSTKLITPRDLVLILKIINPKELSKLILNEIKEQSTKSRNEIGFE